LIWQTKFYLPFPSLSGKGSYWKAIGRLILRSVFLIFLSGLTACESYHKKVISDFNATIKLEAKNQNNQAEIVSIKLRIKSDTSQPVNITLSCNGQLVREIRLKAGDTITVLADCYSNYAEIAFPGAVPDSGSITVEYRFGSI